MVNQQLSTNTFGTAKWIVSPTASDGTHTTIAAALTAASSGDTIFIRPGTYTENPTLKAGVNLTAFGSDSSANGTGNVQISGTCTFTGAGSVTLSGIQLQTNAAALLAVTGSAASIVNLKNCYFNCTNNTGITFSSSSSSAQINLYDCVGDIGTTGIALYSQSSAGSMVFKYCVITNSGSSTTASTLSAGQLNYNNSSIASPIIVSGNGGLTINYSVIQSIGNTIAITQGSSVQSSSIYSNFTSGSASAISVSSGSSYISMNDRIISTNTNAVTGLGTFQYTSLNIASVSALINPTTLSPLSNLVGSLSFDGGNNYLSKYVQGTYTPVLSFGGGSTGITYSTQSGKYTQIGNVVFLSIAITLSSKGSSTGTAAITVPVNATGNLGSMNIRNGNLTYPSGATMILAYLASATSIQITGEGSAQGESILSDTNFANTTALNISGFYYTS